MWATGHALAISDTFMDGNGGIQIETICLSEKQEGGRATADDTKMNLDENEKQQNSWRQEGKRTATCRVSSVQIHPSISGRISGS